MVEIRTATDEDWPSMSRTDARAFGYALTPEEVEREGANMDFERFRVAVDGTEVIGVAGSWALQMTLPGGAVVPTGGVTWVSVAVTHRRRGIMSGLLDAVHDDVDARCEPLAALTASEGGIYSRFGYGIATRKRIVAIDRPRARFHDHLGPPPGTVRIVDAAESVAEIRAMWDRYRTQRPGEIDRDEARMRMDFAANPRTNHALHADGYAAWKFEPRWNDGHPAHELTVLTMAPVTLDAHTALWATVLATDLVGPIRSAAVPHDDPLPFLLTDQRVVRTTDVNDGVWCNVRDVPACFGARTYGTDEDIVVEADGRRWRIGPAGVSRVRTRPDLVTDRAGLGSLLLGGTAATTLVAGRRMEARNAAALRRADALFVVHPLPYSQTGF